MRWPIPLTGEFVGVWIPVHALADSSHRRVRGCLDSRRVRGCLDSPVEDEKSKDGTTGAVAGGHLSLPDEKKPKIRRNLPGCQPST
jgi:hypothetical protein